MLLTLNIDVNNSFVSFLPPPSHFTLQINNNSEKSPKKYNNIWCFLTLFLGYEVFRL